MRTRPICEICGKSSPSESSAYISCGCSFPVDPPASSVERDMGLIAGFGFRRANINTSLFQEAESAFLASLESEASAVEFGYKRENVHENDDAYYFPVGWIGCSGHLVTKSPMRLISFGSHVGAEPHIWAHYKGFSMEPLGKDRRNTFTILSIRDIDNTVRTLNTFLHPRWVENELSLKQFDLPALIEDVDLYFGIRGLLEAERNDWFTFEVR